MHVDFAVKALISPRFPLLQLFLFCILVNLKFKIPQPFQLFPLGMQLSIAAIAALVMGAYYAFKRIIDRGGDPPEPPLVTSSIPFVGHILGMIKKKADYYVELQ